MTQYSLIIARNCLEELKFLALNRLKQSGICLGKRIGNHIFLEGLIGWKAGRRDSEKLIRSALMRFDFPVVGFYFSYLTPPDSFDLENRIVLQISYDHLEVHLVRLFPEKSWTLLRRIRIKGD